MATSSNEATLQEIPVSKFPTDGTMLVTGPSGTGKTVAIRNIMYQLRNDIDVVVIMCGSKDTCEEYREHVPGSFVHYISKFDKHAKGLIQGWYDKMEKLREEGQECRMLMIFDDLAFMKGGVNNDETVTKILYNGRHAGILFIWSQQYALNASPDLRAQTKLVIATYDKIPKNQYRLFDAFNPCFPDTAAGFRDFTKVFESCTEDYGLIAIDIRQSRSKQISDNIYFYCPKYPVPSFKMMKGSKAWKYDELKNKSGKSFTKETSLSSDHGLVVSKLYRKRKRDDREMRSVKKSKRSTTRKRKSERASKKPKREFVTIP